MISQDKWMENAKKDFSLRKKIMNSGEKMYK